jgi:hypothetical protein
MDQTKQRYLDLEGLVHFAYRLKCTVEPHNLLFAKKEKRKKRKKMVARC